MDDVVRISLLIALLTFGIPALADTSSLLAQQPAARTITLEEALQLAETRSEQMAIARAGVDRAGGEQMRARSDLFPQLSGAVSYDRALASEFSEIFESGTAQPCAPFIADPQATVEERLTELERAVDCGATGAVSEDELANLEDLPFGRKNTWRFNISFTQNLYSGGRIGAQTAIANASRESARITLTSTRAQLMLDVVRAYYDAALSDRLVEIAEATYRQADATYEQTRLSFQAGSQPEFDLLRAQVARDNQRPGVIRRRAERDIAILRLKQLLEIPLAERISLTVPLEGDTLAPPAGLAVGVLLTADTAIPEVARATVRQAETVVHQSEANVDIARSQRLPNVNLTSSYGEVAYPSGAFPGADSFRRNWTVGAIMQVPILTGGRLKADEVIARADARESQARLQQARELAVLDTQSAYEELRASQAAWEASAGTVQQAQRAYEIAELRYREGVSTQLELSDARLLLAQSQASRAQAARDLQVARARVGLLPDLPISTTSFTTSPLITVPVTPETQAAPGQSPLTRPATLTVPAATTVTRPGGGQT
jgi:outer membrane protein TolC